MGKILKRTLATIIFVLFLFAVPMFQKITSLELACFDFSVRANALAKTGMCGENLTWTFNPDTDILEISGTGAMRDYGTFEMPWYEFRNELKTVIISEGVTSIGSCAFDQFNRLTSITIPDTVISIGFSSFQLSGLKSVIIPDSVIDIDRYAFNGCLSLEHIELGNNLKNIKFNAFSGCKSLKDITIPESVISIGEDAFSNCFSLKYVKIPKSVRTIGYGAFSNCKLLERIDVDLQNKYYISDSSGVLYNFDKTELICFPSGSKLSSYVIFDSVINIDEWLFYDCDNLTSVTIGKNVKEIGKSAFRDCDNLKMLVVSENIIDIRESAFYLCNKLKKVFFSGTEQEWKNINIEKFNYILFEESLVEIYYNCNEIVEYEVFTYSIIDEKAELICVDDSVSGTVSIPKYFGKNKVVSIGKKAFFSCSNLENIEIPDSVSSIGSMAFYMCYNLQKIKIPESVTYIGDYAFFGCGKLINIKIPCSVEHIGLCAFSDCGFDFIEVSSENKYYCNDEYGVLFDKKISNLILYPSSSDRRAYTVPNSVTSISPEAFSSCLSLESITLSEKLKIIGESAFFFCESLRGVVVPESLEVIGESAFCRAGCFNVYYRGSINQWNKIIIESNNEELQESNINYNSSDCMDAYLYEYTISSGKVTITGVDTSISQTVEIPSTIKGFPVTKIANRGFSECQYIENIIISDNVIEIGEYAFDNCYNLESVIIGSGVKTIGKYAFANLDLLSNVCIGNGVLNINEGAFLYCNSLEKVIIPDSVNIIADSAFEGCEKLSEVRIGSGVTTIGDSAFSSCEKLTNIALGNNVGKIGDFAFWNTNINDVVLSDNLKSIGRQAFSGCDSLTHISIPDSVTSMGGYAFSSCDNLNIVELGSGISSLHEKDSDLTRSFCFDDCEKLVKFIVSSDNKFYSNDSQGVLFDKSQNTLVFYPEGKIQPIYEVPENTTNILSWAFSDAKNLKSIVFHKKIHHIGNDAFKYLEDIYYEGTKEQWESLDIFYLNPNLREATVHYNCLRLSINTKSNSQRIIITPKDATGNFNGDGSFIESLRDKFEKLENVTIKNALGTFIEIDTYSALKSELEKDDIILSCDNFYDYIIPKEVISSWSTSNGTAYKFDALMQKDKKDGKPYVSTVFGREIKSSGGGSRSNISNNEYVEIRTSTLNVNELYKYDIIVSAGNTGSNTTYYISQDNKNPISNSTGIFSSIDIAESFASGKSIYAYVISNGVVSDPVKLNIEIAAPLPTNIKNAFENSTYSLLGPNSQGIKVADSVPILGGSTISMDMFTFPIGVDVTGSRVRISLGFDAFSYESGGTVGGKQKKETEWMNLKKQVKGISDNLKGSEEAWKDYKKLVRNKVTKERLKTKTGFNVGVLGYIELDVSNGVSVTDIYASVNGEFSFSLTQQFAAWIVPLYVSATAKANLGVETQRAKVIDDPNLPLQFILTLLFEPSLKLSGGVGVKKAVSVGIYGKGSLPFENNFATKYRKFAVKGEAGLEAEFFLLSTEISLIDGEFVVYDGYYGQSTYRLLRSFEDDYINKSAPQTQTTVSVISRDYAEDTSEWFGEYPISLYSLADNGVTFNVLQTSIFDQTNPQLVSFGDNVMMVWVQDDASRDTYNRMRLVYSLYDAENDSWSEPKAVYDDGHNDAYPSLATDGENVYVAWQKIDKTVTADDATSIDVFLENSEILVAKYDAINNCFVNATKLTDNEVYDYMPSVVVNNGNAVVYYATNSDNNLMGTDNNTLFRHELGKTGEPIADNQSYIISAVPEIVNGGEKLSYSVDTDGDLSTSDDITVYTISNGKTTSFDKDENEVAYTFTDYSMLDGTETLFVSDMNNIYYEQNGETKAVFNDSRLIEGNISFVEQDTGLSVLWTENNEVGGNEFWTVSYEDGEWTEPVQISNIGSFKVSNVDVAMLGGKLVGVCNMNEMTLDEESGTYTEGVANLCSFTANDFTDISLDIYMVDESKIIPGETSSIDVYVNNVGTTDVTSIEFLLSDTLGTNTTVTKEVNIKSGATELVSLDYLVPENYAATTLTVSASIPGVEESDTEDNTESIEIGKGDLSIIESELVNFGDNYILKAVVENNSSVDAEGVVVSAIFNDSEEDPFEQSEIGTLAKEQYVNYEIAFNKELIEFDENGVGKLYVKVTSASDESADGDNQICVAVTLPQETECAHPLTETIEAKESTCTEVGYDEYTVCNGCNEKITEYVEYPMIDHEDTDRDNLCDACGKTMNDISVGETKTIEIKSNEITYLKFIPFETTEYIFASLSDTDTYGYLYDADKKQLAYNDDGGSGNNFSVTYTLTAGETYYWGARFYSSSKSGSFDVTLTMKEPCRHEDVETDDGTPATCTSNGYTAGTYCWDCEEWIEGHEYIDELGHSYSSSYTIDTEATCTAEGSKSKHCTRSGCAEKTGVTSIAATGHSYGSYKTTKNATCTSSGSKQRTCSTCSNIETASIAELGHSYSSSYTVDVNATCTTEGSKSKHCIRNGCTSKTSVTKIAKLRHEYDNACDRECNICKATRSVTHSYKTTTTKATISKNGKVVNKCSVCGYSKTTTVYYPKTIKISATSYTYNGKTKTPSVTVKDSKGKTLKKNTDYTVEYSKGRKSIGKYTVTVTFKGNYSGIKKLTFEIVPAKVTLSKLTAGPKALTAAWKTVSSVTGYEVQYSTSKKFTSKTTKTVKIKSSKTKKTTIKKLTKGKKYYVRIRAYKTVSKKPIYGAWSSVKNVKVK